MDPFSLSPAARQRRFGRISLTFTQPVPADNSEGYAAQLERRGVDCAHGMAVESLYVFKSLFRVDSRRHGNLDLCVYEQVDLQDFRGYVSSPADSLVGTEERPRRPPPRRGSSSRFAWLRRALGAFAAPDAPSQPESLETRLADFAWSKWPEMIQTADPVKNRRYSLLRQLGFMTHVWTRQNELERYVVRECRKQKER